MAFGVRAVLIVLLFLSASLTPAVAGMPSPIAGPLTTHAPIAIHQNADFTAANGVVSGTGTPGDPYIIRGWSIVTNSIAIYIAGVTRSFVITHNELIVTGNGKGIVIQDVNVPNWVINNDVHFGTGIGVSVNTADTVVADNQITGAGETYSGGTGVYLEKSGGIVRENFISESVVGIKTRYGDPLVRGNNLGFTGSGIVVEHGGVGANVSGNVVANAQTVGIKLNYGTNVSIYGNLVEQMPNGIEAWNCIASDITDNYVHDTTVVGVLLEGCNITVEANLIADGKVGIQVWNSDAVIVKNNVTNHMSYGVEWMMSEGIMSENNITLNSHGVFLHDMGVIRMRFNWFANNTYGMHIPYIARQVIPHMIGNWVNGRSVDGYFDASQRAFYYRDANLYVDNALFDSGFFDGYYGATTTLGAVNFYEVNTAQVRGSTFRDNAVGVYAVNSFNVQINNSNFTNNQIGVQFTVADSMMTPVPTCVGFVKNTTIEIDVDPPATFGVIAEACVVGVFNSTIVNVDVGIKYDAQSSGWIVGNHIYRTATAVWLIGNPGEPNDKLLAHDNRIDTNKVGFLLQGSGVEMANNRIAGNSQDGVRMQVGAHPVMIRNNVTANANGVIDLQSCGTMGATCSKIVRGEGNVFIGNGGVGLKANGGAELTGNKFLDNGGRGLDVSGRVVFRNNVAAGNGGDGAFFGSETDISGSTFTANGASGAVIEGTASLRASAFTHNTQAGIRANAHWVTGLMLNVSFNFDGIIVYEGLPNPTAPAVPYPYVNLAGLWGSGSPVLGNGVVQAVLSADPLFIHRSVIEGNTRNAIRASAAVVNATYNYWGSTSGPTIDTGLTGTFGNSVSPIVHFNPFYRDRTMTLTGPVAGL